MDWPVAAVVISVIVSLAGCFKALVYSGAEARANADEDQIDHLWTAYELLSRDVERITPIEISLLDH